MTVEDFAQMVVDALGVDPTGQQRALIDALARFCASSAPPTAVFLLNGYAGTGKTSVVAALVKALQAVRRPTVLLAPTGRAAKVLSEFAGKKAMTIHRKIYRGYGDVTAVAGVGDNPHSNAIFIVDEASMIGEGAHDSLLEDLVQYVYGSGHDCRMILLGDGAQLPPVGCAGSPAMSPERLRQLGLRVSRAVITQTVRQKAQSGILHNATALRKAMLLDKLPVPDLAVAQFDDVAVIGGEDLQDALSQSYSSHGIDETILITRSNKRAMEFNLAIRRTILEKEEVISRDEPLLIAKNNYYWTSKVKGVDFIANGDVVKIKQIYGTEIKGFLRFADVQLAIPDTDVCFDAKIILNSLNSSTAGLEAEHEQMLLDRCMANIDPALRSNPEVCRKALHADPYFNALRVKYAYAVTCHKAQGGQWESVFVDMGNIAQEAVTTPDFYRWLYTAVTRARVKLTLIAPTLPVC